MREGFGFLGGNFGFMVSTDFLPLFFSRLEAMDLESLMYVSSDILTTLKGLELF